MAQFLRPDSTVTATGFTGGFAEIDEATASDADRAYGTADKIASVLEVGLSNPTGTPASGTTTVRYRLAKVTSANVLDGAGDTVTVTAALYQGTTLIASDTAKTATATFTDYSFAPDVSGVTDWTDLRLRFTTAESGGGGGANRRSAAISWAEVEAPDGVVAASLPIDSSTHAHSSTSPTLAPKGIYPVINLAGTTVTDQGGGVYRVVKTAVDGWTNAEAYTASGVTGDFTLRIMHNSGGAYATWSASFGVSDHDPTLATSNELEDYGFIIQGSDIYTHRLGVRSIYTSSRTGPWWLGREGDTIKWKSGGSSWATATLDDSQTGTSGLSVKLDSSLYHNGASFDLRLADLVPAAATDSATHAHTASEPTLTPHAALAVDSSTHAHSAASPTLIPNAPITVQSATHAHSASSPTIADVSSTALPIDNSVHAHTSSSPTLAAKSALTVNSATHSQTATQPALAAASAVAVSSASHAHSSTQPSLAAASSVSINSAAHAHSSTSPTLAAKSAVATDNAVHGHTATSPIITVQGAVGIDSATHAHSASSPALTPHATVTVDNILHGHTASEPIVTQNTSTTYVAVNSANHGHSASQAFLRFFWPTVDEPTEEPWADETPPVGTWTEQSTPAGSWTIELTPSGTWTTTEPSEGAWT